MVRVSERTFGYVNLGGIAEAEAFVPCVGQGLFFLRRKSSGSSCMAKNLRGSAFLYAGMYLHKNSVVLLYPFRFGETGRPSAA